MRYQADELRYEQVTVLEKEAIFTDLRVLRDSVPKGFSCYEVRHDDESLGNPVEIARGILVNFYGTLLVQGSLEQHLVLGEESIDIFYLKQDIILK